MPVLVHIGYHKAASTWLQRELFVDRTGYRWLGKRPRSHSKSGNVCTEGYCR